MSTIEVPVSHTKKQEIQQKIADIMKSQKEELAKRIQFNNQHAKLMTEKILREFKSEKAHEEKLLNSTESMYIPAESNFFVAIQLRSQVKIAPRPKKTLSLLRLNQINTCVVVRNNQSIKNMLQNAKDYIAYGTISYELLRKLVYTRGYGKINGAKVKLTNENIEDCFEGKFKCVEELCNVIYHGKDDIKEVLKFLCPFRLSPPKGGFPNGHKKRDFIQGGSSNDHKNLLGNLLEKMI